MITFKKSSFFFLFFPKKQESIYLFEKNKNSLIFFVCKRLCVCVYVAEHGPTETEAARRRSSQLRAKRWRQCRSRSRRAHRQNTNSRGLLLLNMEHALISFQPSCPPCDGHLFLFSLSLPPILFSRSHQPDSTFFFFFFNYGDCFSFLMLLDHTTFPFLLKKNVISSAKLETPNFNFKDIN